VVLKGTSKYAAKQVIMHPVIQEEKTGCAIASCAAIAGLSYQQAQSIARSLGIYADDPALWSETHYIKKLLAAMDIVAANKEIPFSAWDELPNCALLAIKWHQISNRPFWHWVVFTRNAEQSFVLDSNPGLKNNIRTDFGRIKPHWYIEIVR